MVGESKKGYLRILFGINNSPQRNTRFLTLLRDQIKEVPNRYIRQHVYPHDLPPLPPLDASVIFFMCILTYIANTARSY